MSPTASPDIDVDLGLFEDLDHEKTCQSSHSTPTGRNRYCSVEVTHWQEFCLGGKNVCAAHAKYIDACIKDFSICKHCGRSVALCVTLFPV